MADGSLTLLKGVPLPGESDGPHSMSRTSLGYDTCPSSSTVLPYPSTFFLSLVMCIFSTVLLLLIVRQYNCLKLSVDDGPTERHSAGSLPADGRKRDSTAATVGKGSPRGSRAWSESETVYGRSTHMQAAGIGAPLARGGSLARRKRRVYTGLTSNTCWVAFYASVAAFFCLNTVVCGVKSFTTSSTSLAAATLLLSLLQAWTTFTLSYALLYQLKYRSSDADEADASAAAEHSHTPPPAAPPAVPPVAPRPSAPLPPRPIASPVPSQTSSDSASTPVATPINTRVAKGTICNTSLISVATGTQANGYGTLPAAAGAARPATATGPQAPKRPNVAEAISRPDIASFAQKRLLSKEAALFVLFLISCGAAVAATPNVGFHAELNDGASKPGSHKNPENFQYWLFVLITMAQRVPIYLVGFRVVFPFFGLPQGAEHPPPADGFNPQSHPSPESRAALAVALLVDLTHLYACPRNHSP